MGRIGHSLDATAGRMERERRHGDEPLAEWIKRALTPRELEILLLLAANRDRQEVASHLRLKPKTVEQHLYNAKQKLNPSYVRYGRSDWMVLCLRAGLIGVDDLKLREAA